MDVRLIVDYFAHGGLVAILEHGMEGVPYSRAWLNLDAAGRVTHTFSATKGGIGGSNIPFNALENGKVREERLTMVIAFLRSFGLDANQAEQVIYAIGIEGVKSGPQK